MKKKATLIWVQVGLAILILVMVVIGVLLNLTIRETMENKLNTELKANAYIVKTEVDSFFESYLRKANIIGHNPMFISYIQNTTDKKLTDSEAQEVKDELNRLDAIPEAIYFAWIYTVATEEFYVADSALEKLTPYDHTLRQTSKSVSGGKPSVSPVYINQNTNTPMLTMHSDIPGSQGILGQIGFNLDLSEVQAGIHDYEMAYGCEAIIIDEQGNYISAGDGWSSATNIREDRGLHPIRQRILSQETGHAKLLQKGVPYYTYFMPMDSVGWSVLVHVPAANVNHEVMLMAVATGLIIGLSLLIFIVFAVVLRMNDHNKELVEINEQLMAQEAYISEMANIDPLTGMPNRRKFMEFLSTYLEENSSGFVMLLDLDNFKEINDTKGHVYGDEILKEVGQRLMILVDFGAYVSRFGGDEFLILVDRHATPMSISVVAEKLIQLFNKPINVGGDELIISFSAGISRYPQDSIHIHELVMYADTAMYHVKNTGKSDYVLFTAEMARDIIARMEHEKILRNALDDSGFTLAYQPQVDPVTMEVVSAEALCRLKDSSLSPGVFIPIAEETGMILELGRRIATEAIQQLALWQSKGYKPVPIAVNYSLTQLKDLGFPDFLADLMAQYQIPADLLHIEITESFFMENEPETLRTLEQFKAMGIVIALDDFGSGYSSIGYLNRIPVDILKLDKTICDRYTEPMELNLIQSIIHLAHGINLSVIAEGIEKEDQVSLLIRSKCDLVQGYYYSKPISASEFETLFYTGEDPADRRELGKSIFISGTDFGL